MLEFGHIGLLVNRGVGRDLVTKNYCHTNCGNAFLKDPFALHDQVMRALQTVQMDIPIHPLRGRNHGTGGFCLRLPYFFRLSRSDKLLGEERV